jgi:hypothetical protein
LRFCIIAWYIRFTYHIAIKYNIMYLVKNLHASSSNIYCTKFIRILYIQSRIDLVSHFFNFVWIFWCTSSELLNNKIYAPLFFFNYQQTKFTAICTFAGSTINLLLFVKHEHWQTQLLILLTYRGERKK